MLIRTGFLASGRAQEVAIPDLVAWSDLGFATNKLGAIVFTDVTAHLSPRKFYRACSSNSSSSDPK